MRNYKIMPGGILNECFCNVRNYFYDNIDENIHAHVYDGVHDDQYAEPEFTGKFLDICAYYYETEKDERALNKGMQVISGIEKAIHQNGYLGGLEADKKLKFFSVWNQGFTLYGISRMYEATKYDTIYSLMIRTADWIINEFTGTDAPDILDALNDGSENISVLYAIGRVYLITKEEKYINFIKNVLAYCENTNMNLLSFHNILELRSKKGIEMLVIYLGVLQYGIFSKNNTAVSASERYWDQINTTQIRNTGNGTLKELWTSGGNTAMLLSTDEKPNETCVAVGWLELTLALFFNKPMAKYLNAIEKTVFNHMLGSLAPDGSDIAYYQGNYGKKIFRKDKGMYQCCRYRGYTFFSYLKEYLYYLNENEIIPIIYSPSALQTDGLTVIQKTDYPKNGTILFEISNDHSNRKLKLFKPVWCDKYQLFVNGKVEEHELSEGFIIVDVPKGNSQIKLELIMTVKIFFDEIDEKKYAWSTYGPLLLAMDTRFGNDLWSEVDSNFSPIPCENSEKMLVHFQYKDIHYIDFASAGKRNPKDSYTVFFPVKE